MSVLPRGEHARRRQLLLPVGLRQFVNVGLELPREPSPACLAATPRPRLAEVTDGLSNTFMVGETLPTHCVWQSVFVPNFPLSGTMIPLNTMEAAATNVNPGRVCGYKSLHPNGASFAMGDGSVRFVSRTIDYRLYNYIGSRAGGEQVTLD
jgi:prepilin-type processing-associated H-X9-DG protein